MIITEISDSNFRKFAPFLLLSKERQGLTILGAETPDGDVAGTAVLCAHETWQELVSVYVVPSFRRIGAGRELLFKARELNDHRGGLPIVADFSDETEGLQEFFRETGFYVLPGKRAYEFSLKDTVAVYDRIKGASSDGIRSVSELTREERNEASEFLKSFGWSGDLIDGADLRGDLSFTGKADGKVSGILLVSRDEEKTLFIDRVATAQGNRRLFSALIRCMIDGMRHTEAAGTKIRFFGENEKLVETARMLLGDALRPLSQYFTAVG